MTSTSFDRSFRISERMIPASIEQNKKLTASPIKSAAIKHLEFGVVHYFGAYSALGEALLSGWAEPEDGHNWNNGCESVLDFVSNATANACRIEITGEPFLHQLRPYQDVILHVNGFKIGHWRLNTSGQCALEAILEPEQVFRRGDSGLFRCAWSFPCSITPAELGNSGDSRDLAFCFRSILISEA